MEPDDFVISTDYSNSIKQGDEEDNAMERSFRKECNACVPVYVLTKNCSDLAINAECFSKYFVDEMGKVYDYYIAEFSKDYWTIVSMYLATESQIRLRCA